MRTQLGPALQVGEELVWKGEGSSNKPEEQEEDRKKGEGNEEDGLEIMKETELAEGITADEDDEETEDRL